jgi:hypothetical protein
VHVEAQPVAGAVHVELAVAAGFEHAVEAALEQAQVDEALGEHPGGGVVGAFQPAPGRVTAMAAAWAASTSS